MPRMTLSIALLAILLVADAATAGVVMTPGGVRFTYEGNASSVALAGSFNDWSASAQPMDNEGGGLWSTVVRLPAGLHEYKFVVDGEWITDPGNAVTFGAYGNSALQITEQGTLGELESSSNTEYSEAIKMGGRFRNLYLSRVNRDQDRLELRRPSFDIDMNFGVTFNDLMTANVLMKVNNETENVDIWKTRMNFDRGHLHYSSNTLQFWAWDNEGLVRFDDPLRLVGDVGIYSYDFGYLTQGFSARREYAGFQFQGLFADNFLDGGQNSPDAPDVVPAPAASQLVDGRFEPAVNSVYDYNYAWTDEDIVAGRVTRDLDRNVRAGFTARLDRGFNPNGFGLLDRSSFAADTLNLEVVTTDSVDTLSVPGIFYDVDRFQGWEESWALAGDVVAEDVYDGIDVSLEVAYGKTHATGRDGLRNRAFLGTVTTPDTTFAIVVNGDDAAILDETDQSAPTATEGDKFELGDSVRFLLGLSNITLPANLRAAAGLEYWGMNHTELATGGADLENRALIYRADLQRPAGGRLPVALGVAVEAWDFDYAEGTPWEFQFWFDERNFWLENGNDKVSRHRLVFLGGDDVLFYRPYAAWEGMRGNRLRLRYDGTIGSTGINREPKYFESIVQATYDLTPRWELHGETRIVRYDDPVLELSNTYDSYFLEAKWKLDEGIELAVSYGVDPVAFDFVTNEYGRIGRDQYLFERGANAATARANFASLRQSIDDAERELTEEKVLQLEAIVRF